MKRLALLFAFAFMALGAEAQNFDMIMRNRNIDVRMTLKDAATDDPVSYASVYLIPQGDTVITHFSLSDANGDVRISEVPQGKYEVNVEMMGYLPYRKVHDFKGARRWEEDLGIIKLSENAEFLDAAKVTAAGNPIVIKKDTIEYNASAYRVGENAMLGELLDKMPGIEVSDDGSVKVNGESVSKITVGGKTFFFEDPSMAVKNLPAKVVDKVKVIDKKKDDAAFSGVASESDREKVMDLALKEQYTTGWFGNAKVLGGLTLVPDTGDGLIDNEGLLYDASGMATGYTEHDQIVFVGSASNAGGNGSMRARRQGNSVSVNYGGNGLNRSAQAGVNVNTDRIKQFETSLSVNYKNDANDTRRRSARTAFQADGSELQTDGTSASNDNSNSVTASYTMDHHDEKSGWFLEFRPSLSWTGADRRSSNASSTKDASGILNSTDATTFSHNDMLSGNLYLGAGLKDLGGRKGRTVMFDVWGNFTSGSGNSSELSTTVLGGGTQVKDLLYDNADKASYMLAELSYVEPLSDDWRIQAELAWSNNKNGSDKVAFNGADGSPNDYYSSYSDNNYTRIGETVRVQYEKDNTTLLGGFDVEEVQNVTRARSLGVESVAGEGEWLTNLGPFLYFRKTVDSDTFSANYMCLTNQPSNSMMQSMLNISNPVQISTGNIYLKPSLRHSLSGGWRKNNRERFSFVNLNLGANLNLRNTVYASWFDNDGVRYAVPVNSRKPSSGVHAYATYSTPLTSDRNLTLEVSANGSYNTSTSYQSKSRMAGIDLQTFDYTAFMSSFWGDKDGDVFYAGKSGFQESTTNTVNYTLSANFKYNLDRFTTSLSGMASNRISRYSLDPTADIDTWDFTVNDEILYQTPKGWEFKNNIGGMFYSGYSAGYGDPCWIWCLEVNKTFGMLTLTVRANDILNQTRNLTRTVSAEYLEDVYTNVLGRYIMAGVTFNFGKMNAKRNSNVTGAMFDMMF